MDNLVRTTLNALEVAGSLAGVPYVGAAAIVLRNVVECCQQVGVHKRKSNALADKCAQLLLTLQEQSSRMESSELLQTVDQVTFVLEKVQKRVRVWSRYNKVMCFWNNKQIEEGLDMCNSEIDTAMNIFSMNAQIVIHEAQREHMNVYSNNTAEMQELLFQILTNTNEMRRIQDMERAGQHVAEPIMHAGQLELRHLREQHDDPPMTGHMTSSPPPSPRDGERYLQYQRGLINLHRATGIPPSVKRLNGEVTKQGDLAIAGGTYSDIWLGLWLGEEKVALKALRNIKANDPKAQKRFEHEINVWAKLQHDHILPFYGIVTDLGQHIHTVSPWQENGNVLEYVKKNVNANKIHLLFGAAKGLDFLHSQNVVHGNVKCTNILVSLTGEASICDFGMSKVIEDVTEKSASATLTAAGSARWLAPELIEGTISSPEKPSDVYSYAMAILELLTLKHPYAYLRRDASVIHCVVLLKKTPAIPDDDEAKKWLTTELWSLMQDCWRSLSVDRPEMSAVASRMEEIDASAIGSDHSNAMDTS